MSDFNLSDKRQFNGIYDEEDVKEFIKVLKELANKHSSGLEYINFNLNKELDELGGKKLI